MSSEDEKENTYRSLADKDLLVTSRLCRFGIHKWTKWKKIREHIIQTYDEKKYYDLEMRRECVHCGIVKSKVWRLRRAAMPK